MDGVNGVTGCTDSTPHLPPATMPSIHTLAPTGLKTRAARGWYRRVINQNSALLDAILDPATPEGQPGYGILAAALAGQGGGGIVFIDGPLSPAFADTRGAAGTMCLEGNSLGIKVSAAPHVWVKINVATE